jgi:hypothetical protein
MGHSWAIQIGGCDIYTHTLKEPDVIIDPTHPSPPPLKEPDVIIDPTHTLHTPSKNPTSSSIQLTRPVPTICLKEPDVIIDPTHPTHTHPSKNLTSSSIQLTRPVPTICHVVLPIPGPHAHDQDRTSCVGPYSMPCVPSQAYILHVPYARTPTCTRNRKGRL